MTTVIAAILLCLVVQEPPKPSDDPVWEPDPALLSKLGPTFDAVIFGFRPPEGWAVGEISDKIIITMQWTSPKKDDVIRLTRLSQGNTGTSEFDPFDAAKGAIFAYFREVYRLRYPKARLVRTEPEEGLINGIRFTRVRATFGDGEGGIDYTYAVSGQIDGEPVTFFAFCDEMPTVQLCETSAATIARQGPDPDPDDSAGAGR